MKRYFDSVIELLPVGQVGRFVGALVPTGVLYPDIFLMRNILRGDAAHYENCFKIRYGDNYHVTLINSIEFQDISPEKIGNVLSSPIRVELLGLGRLRADGGDTFYSVCRSSDMTELRSTILSASYDFHITLGFDGVNVHKGRKGVETLVG